MKPKLKKVRDQVIVITGASSGIGLATARRAAEEGAQLVLAARNEDALLEITDELKAQGKTVVHVVADVGVEEDVQRVARTAVDQLGRIDTWVNNAGVSIYGRLIEVSMEDSRKLFETNFWGVVHGSRAAVEHMKTEGGALINIGSVLSDRAMPLQGMYASAKHAVKAFTDTLRMELEEMKLPISVTLIKPGAIDTPYTEHAKSYLEVEPKHTPPVYAPRIVADAILHAAEHPVRDLFVGGGAKAIAAAGTIAPRLTDKLMEKAMFRSQKSDKARERPEMNALYGPAEDGREYSAYPYRVRQRSLYTAIEKHPVIAGLLGGLLTAGAIVLFGRGARAV